MSAPDNDPTIRRHDMRLAAALAGACLLAFLPALFAGFFWDDHFIVRADGPIADLGSILTAFRGRMTLFPQAAHYPYYRPLVDISFILNYAIGGMHPFGYHLFSVALHIANAVLLFALLRRIGARAEWAFAGTALFALHPLAVEAVAWIASRNIVMCVLFLLAMLHAARSTLTAERMSKCAGWSAASVLCFAFAMLCKETAIVAIPCGAIALLAADRRSLRRAGLLLSAHVVAGALYVALNPAAGSGMSGALEGLGIGEVAGACNSVAGFYASKFLLPFGLYPSYPIQVDRTALSLALGATFWLGLLVLGAWATRKRTPASAYAFAALAFAGGSAILPLFGGQFLLSDRYAYQSLAAIGMAIGVAGCAMSDRRAVYTIWGFVAVLGVMTLNQTYLWVREDVLWAHAVECDPENVHANYQLGLYFAAHGETERAREHYRAAAFSTHPPAHVTRRIAAMNLAKIDFASGDHDAALKDLDVAETGYPANHAEALVLRAIIANAQGDSARAGEFLSQLKGEENVPAGVALNAALLCLRGLDDRQAAAEWYARAIAAGAAPNAELEAALAP